MLFKVSLLFTLIGLLFLGLGITFFFTIDVMFMAVIFALLGLCISLLGITLLTKSKKMQKAHDEIFIKGTKYSAQIVNHISGTGVTFNGMLPIALVLKCTVNGIEREFTYNTNEYDASKYPINAYCDLYLYGVKVVVDKKSIHL